MKRFFILFILSFFVLLSSFSATPEGRLFQFERSTNRNYICYDVNLKDGMEIQLNNMFDQMKGESLTCLYVDVTGIANGKTVTKRINNK